VIALIQTQKNKPKKFKIKFMKSTKFMAAFTAGLVLLSSMVAQAQSFPLLYINIKAYQQIITTNTLRTLPTGKVYSYTYTIKTNTINNTDILKLVAAALGVTLPRDPYLAIAGADSPNISPGLSKIPSVPFYKKGDVVIVDQSRSNVLYALNGSLNNASIYVGIQDAIFQTNNNNMAGVPTTTVIQAGLGQLYFSIYTPNAIYWYNGLNNALTGFQTGPGVSPKVSPKVVTSYNSYMANNTFSGAGELIIYNGNYVFLPSDVSVSATATTSSSIFPLFPNFIP